MVRKLILFLLLAIPTLGYSQVMEQFNQDSLFGIFSPLDDDSLNIWLHAGANVDSISGTPGSDGDKIETWTDLSPNAKTFTRATYAERPTLRTNQLNGYPILEFFYNQQLRGNLASGPNRGMLFFVIKNTLDTTTTRKFFTHTSGGTRPSCTKSNTEREGFFSGAGTLVGASSMHNTWVLLTYRMDTDITVTIRKDGAYSQNGAKTNTQNFSGVNVWIGNGGATDRNLVAEIIFTNAVNLDTMYLYEEYLRNKYNLY